MRFSTSLLLLLLLPVFTPLGWAQAPAQRQTIDWSGKTTIRPQGKEVEVPVFTGAAFVPNSPLPHYALRLTGYVDNFQLTDATYTPFSGQEGKSFDVPALTATPAFTLHHGLERGQPVTLVSLVPLRRNPQSNQPEKLASFTYSFTQTASTAARGTNRTYAASSVLNQGDWFKIGIAGNVEGGGDGSGIYKLTKEFLRTLGLPVQSLDPARLQLYGNAIGMLPQANSAPRPDDLQQNALHFVGNADATFDDNEYFLFYARSPHTWQPTQTPGQRGFRHVLNLYTDTTYYFLTVGTAASSRRVQARATVSGTPTATITNFWERQFYELELVNLLHSGRRWLGEGFNSGTQKSVTFPMPDLVADSLVRVTASVAAAAPITTTFNFALNSTALGTVGVTGISSASYPPLAESSTTTFQRTVPAGTSSVAVSLTYNANNEPTAAGYLDYLEVQAVRQLNVAGAQLPFRSLQNVRSGAFSTFALSNTSGVTVWDVTQPTRPQAVALNNSQFVARTDSVREYVAFRGSDFGLPRAFGRVANQNLHALNQVNLLIVTHPAFLAQAKRLAQHRSTNDPALKPAVVTTTQIYNEFSSGGQDISAIRDFVKMVYDRGPKQNLYVLLFGDASYDYKADPTNNVSQEPAWWSKRQIRDSDNQNYVPTYESVSSFNRVDYPPSYCSDDFFGFLDDNEGEWAETTFNDVDFMDAAVGRLPIRASKNSTADAAATLVVDKLIAYDQIAAQGKWRNRITFVSDDGDGNGHISSSEMYINVARPLQPAFNITKLYLDMFPQQTSAGGQRSPAMNAALDAALEQGTVMMSYSGHGGPKGWTDEQILTNASVLQLQNRNNMTFMFTGTCDFAWYDDPAFTSAGEQVLTDNIAGAIGLLTTTRLVYASNNESLGSKFFTAQMTRTASGAWPRLGDAVSFAKNNDGVDLYNRNLTLLGDPSMRLALPRLQANVRLLNGQPITSTTVIKALQRVKLEGDVTNNGALAGSFNGTIQVTVFEKASTITTLGDQDTPIPVTVQRDIIYDGKASVAGGKFQVEFIVPKDINYQVGTGKISLYAADPSQNIDAHGYNSTLSIGDADQTARADSIPPEIRLFMDTEAFVFGGLTKPNTTLLGLLSDDNGINTAGTGIGHEITATLDGHADKVTVLNDYYTADVDKFTSGRVAYLFKNLEVGPHSLKVKAWDTHNNSAEKTVEFIVAHDATLALDHVLNYPNPFANHTTFHFDHNRAGDDLEVQVQIFTVSGKLVRTLQASVPGSQSHIKSIDWDGRDEFQDQLARGVYVYRVNVRSLSTDTQVSKFEKLVLLN